jgi:proline iminopeptidase
VRDLEAIRTALRVDRMHLLGYSAGGFVALEYALKHPQRLRSLLLCGTAGSAEEIREANRIMLRAASPVQRRRLRSLTLLGAFGTPEYESLVEQIGRPFQTRFLPADSPPLGRLSPNVYRAMMTRTGDEFVVDGTLARWDARSGYRRLRTPTLVLVGRFDFFLGAARRAAAAIPGAELIVLARSSHMGPLEEPVAFRSAVDRFLRRVKPARPGSSRPADPARIAPSRRVGRTRPVRSVRGAR